MSSPKIIVFDLEIIPNLQKALQYWTRLSSFPGKTLKATVTSICCAGWKYLDDHETHCINAWDFPEWIDDVNNDYYVCEALYEVLSKADVVVSHNGKRFDWKYFQTRLMYNGFKPLQKIHHVDTCQLAKSNLYLIDNKLNTVAELTARDEKMHHEGWDLWVKTHNRDKKSMDIMEAYCKQDVALLEKVYYEMRPFMKNLPNRNLFRTKEQLEENVLVCSTCGSENIFKNGNRYTKTGFYQQFGCKDCGSYSRSNTKGYDLRSF